MLGAVAAWDWALRAGTADECSELALALLADGWLITLDAGFMALVAARVLVIADRDGTLGSERNHPWTQTWRVASSNGTANGRTK